MERASSRHCDGLIVEFGVTQVRGHLGAGLLLEDDFSSLRVVEVVKELRLTTCERGVFGQGARLSVGGVPAVYCSDDDHMEEEVQLRVQVEEEGMGETHGKGQGEEQRVKERTLKRTTSMTMEMT